jgi:uncharacterized protein YegL
MKRFAIIIIGLLLLVQVLSAQEVYVDNVVIILDASGSMSGVMSGTGIKKITSAKAAIKEVLKTIPGNTQIGLLVFGGRANGWVYQLGPRDDAKLLQAVSGLSAKGGTPLGAYMKMGADRLLKVRESQYGYGSYRLLIVTDGEADDEDLVARYTPDIISRGIIMDVIGVDMAHDHALATKAHSYRRANDPASLKRAIQEVFAEVGKSADAQSGESAFEELDGLSNEMALKIISALISSGNHPIGGSSKSEVADAVSSDTSVTQSTPYHGVGSSKKKKGFGFMTYIVIGVIIFSVLKGGKQTRR